jgi:5-methylcytosine-specific restriction endonuclease McrA
MNRPCMICAAVTAGGARCQAHQIRRNRHLAATALVVLLFRDGLTCWICGAPTDRNGAPSRRPTVDHVIPLASGGTDHPDNLRVAHGGCNSARRPAVSY